MADQPVRLAPEASPVGQPAVWWRLEDLDPWGENPRAYTKQAIASLAELIDAATDTGGLVVDLFGGGGSTLLAAARKERRAYLVEIDPLWCDVIRHRWTAWALEAGQDPGTGALVLEDAPQLLGKAAGGKPTPRSRKAKAKAKARPAAEAEGTP